jgi:hypothetical protein
VPNQEGFSWYSHMRAQCEDGGWSCIAGCPPDQDNDRQERDLRAYAERAGYEIVGVFRETLSGIRKAKGKQPVERQRAIALGVGASAFGLGGVWGAYKRRLLPTAVCAVGQVALLLGHWRELVVYYERHPDERA